MLKVGNGVPDCKIRLGKEGFVLMRVSFGSSYLRVTTGLKLTLYCELNAIFCAEESDP